MYFPSESGPSDELVVAATRAGAKITDEAMSEDHIFEAVKVSDDDEGTSDSSSS